MPETPDKPTARAAYPDRLGGTVWLTAQQNSRAQRTGRYLPESVAHPAKMLPEIARQAIQRFTEPGDLVIDPMCGIGTTLVEASHLGRRSFGVEYEPRWAQIAERNLAHARAQGATGQATVVRADARQLLHAAPENLRGQAALVITSPPYGASLHGQVRSTKETGQRGVQKFDYRYSRDKTNLAHVSVRALIDGFAQILTGCAALLRPGGIIAVTARPWREHGSLIDLPGHVLAAGALAGLTPIQRAVALLAGIRDGRLIARPSFFQLANVRRARDEGEPQSVITHEDLILLQKRGLPTAPAPARLLPLPQLSPAAWSDQSWTGADNTRLSAA
ncbi:MAG TPA: DNA methyltransferase [Actinocrinis sp.]|uniref:TRM11 family SAM-dependent methyltransferase n=1 Tax=Actinocrinis sp. TaxID=1920516 RepID=UPI002DDD3514|nr:DNA methyltransferase [Actinocrinis sp.]HEV2345803.1 DNA methyltransferase [Actinocrinis sp.]